MYMLISLTSDRLGWLIPDPRLAWEGATAAGRGPRLLGGGHSCWEGATAAGRGPRLARGEGGALLRGVNLFRLSCSLRESQAFR